MKFFLHAGWLIKCPDQHRTRTDQDQAFCKWCMTPLRCHKNSLNRHMDVKRHQERAKTRICKTQKTLTKCGKVSFTKFSYFFLSAMENFIYL